MFTAVAAVVLSLGPGLMLGFAAPPGRTRWLAWTCAPALTLGLVAVGLSWLGPLGLPRGAEAVLVAELLVALVVVAAGWGRARHRGVASGWWRIAPGAPNRLDAIAVSLVAAVTAVFGGAFFGAFRQPPGWDAMYHGMLTREILQHGTTAVSAICRTGSTASSQACRFTPLGLDTTWAQAAQLSGGRIGTAMLTWEALIGPIATVVAVYVLARMLRAPALVAAAAAVTVNVVGPLWMSTATGRITQEVTPGLAVSTVVLLTVAARAPAGRCRTTCVALAGLAAGGVVLAHTYEILFVAVLGAAVVGLGLWGRFRDRLGPAVGAPLVAALAVAPSIGGLFAADNERTAVAPAFAGDPLGALRFWVTDPNRYLPFGFPSPSAVDHGTITLLGRLAQVSTMVCLLASLLCIVRAELRWARPWLATWAVFTALGVWTSSSNSAAARSVAGLWYGIPERLRSLMTPTYAVLTVAGAAAIGLALQPLVGRRRHASRHQRWSSGRAAVAGAVAIVVLLLACASAPATRRPLASDLAARTPQGSSYERASMWLAEHLPRPGVAAYDQNLDMVTWSYVDDQVGFLFGEPPVTGAQATDYDLRWQVWNWLVDNPGAVPAGCLVNRYHVQFVVIGEPHVPNFPAHYVPARVIASPRLDLVHVDGKIKIYKVNETGRACATTPTG